MTQCYTMMLMKHLICTVLLVFCALSIQAKNVENDVVEPKWRNNAVAQADLRGISDVWGKVKDGAIETWNYIKTVGEHTKAKIKIFVANVKQYAIDLRGKFVEKLQELRNRVDNIISDIYGTGELVKQCMRKEQGLLENILRQIMAKMGQCIAEEINDLSTLVKDDSEPVLNQTMFIRYLDARKELCENDIENIQECLCSVREEIFDNFTSMENKLLQNHFEARSLTDDIKGTLVTCSISNLIEATNLISTEIVEIAQCVIEAKRNHGELI